MNGKKAKKLREMSAMFFQAQPPSMPNKQTLDEIYNKLKKIQTNGKSKSTRTI